MTYIMKKQYKEAYTPPSFEILEIPKPQSILVMLSGHLLFDEFDEDDDEELIIV